MVRLAVTLLTVIMLLLDPGAGQPQLNGGGNAAPSPVR